MSLVKRVEELWTLMKKENCQTFIILKGRQKEYISHFLVLQCKV